MWRSTAEEKTKPPSEQNTMRVTCERPWKTIWCAGCAMGNKWLSYVGSYFFPSWEEERGKGLGWEGWWAPYCQDNYCSVRSLSELLLFRGTERNGVWNRFPGDGVNDIGPLAIMVLAGNQASTTQNTASAFLPVSFVLSPEGTGWARGRHWVLLRDITGRERLWARGLSEWS